MLSTMTGRNNCPNFSKNWVIFMKFALSAKTACQKGSKIPNSDCADVTTRDAETKNLIENTVRSALSAICTGRSGDPHGLFFQGAA